MSDLGSPAFFQQHRVNNCVPQLHVGPVALRQNLAVFIQLVPAASSSGASCCHTVHGVHTSISFSRFPKHVGSKMAGRYVLFLVWLREENLLFPRHRFEERLTSCGCYRTMVCRLCRRNTAPADPFGIPATFCYLLVTQRSAINPPTDKTLQDSRGKQHVVVSTHTLAQTIS